MKIRMFLCASVFLLFAQLGEASSRGNIREEFANKFSIMRKLSVFCRSTNENTALKSLNSLRDVFFRGNEDLGNAYQRSYQQSIFGITEKMNSDVDKIYTGITHLENSLKVSDPDDTNDKYMNELLRFLIVSEIGMIVSDQHFFTARDKVLEDLNQSLQFIRSAMYIPPTQNPGADIIVLDKLENLIDLAGYIYNEQIQWLMSSSYALQSLDIASFTIEGDSVFKGFAISQPPRIYIPVQDAAEYKLTGH